MYVELKSDGLRGEGRIVRVRYSKTGKTIYYGDRVLVSTRSTPLKANFYDEKSLEDFWVSGPKKDGTDSLFPATINIDDEVREEYWINIRDLAENKLKASYKSPGYPKAERAKIEKGLRRRQMDNGWMPT
jgi:hypothetical protein